MNSDDFEKRLERQTIRKVPDEWRREILAKTKNHSVSPRLNHQLSTLLWPCPQAWAGLAAVWLVILTLNFAMQEPESKRANATPPSPELMATMKEQRRLYLELAGLNVKEVAEPPKPAAPRPRSDRKTEFQIV